MRLILLLSLLILTLAAPASAQFEPPCAAGGGTDEAEITCSLEITFTVDYPRWVNDYPDVSEAVVAFLNAERMAFFDFASEFWDPFIFGMWTEISYDEFSHGELTSILFEIYTYTGGAHPNGYFQTFTVDTETGELLTLADLFTDETAGLKRLSEISLAAVTETMGEFSDPQWIADGTAPTPENFANWVLEDGTLTVIFPAYQVAPYAAGPQRVDISLDDLADVLNPALLGVG